ncbi:MAG: ABC transporter ATP-binding protein [Clostridiales bacterium]|nr:ABC transporter ATP-binding protein [Clostridiales bacterium]
MNKILEVKNVTKYYGGGQAITKALDGISLDVEKGEFVAIMGASGSGKSTLLNVIATIDNVSSGDIILDGQNICDCSDKALASFRRDKLGFIFQDYNLLDTLTVEENIILPLNLARVPKDKTDALLKDIAVKLGVEDKLKQFPYELSGGQRQRASAARALITSPSLVLADEPTGALDSKNSKLLMGTFNMMNADLGATILMVTHDAVVGSYASRVLFLKDGKIWSELVRGNKSRQDMYAEIISVTSALGGDGDVR